MFADLTNFGGSLFDEFRRLQDEVEGLYGRWPMPAGIRSVARGTSPPIHHRPTSHTCLSRLPPRNKRIYNIQHSYCENNHQFS